MPASWFGHRGPPYSLPFRREGVVLHYQGGVVFFFFLFSLAKPFSRRTWWMALWGISLPNLCSITFRDVLLQNFALCGFQVWIGWTFRPAWNRQAYCSNLPRAWHQSAFGLCHHRSQDLGDISMHSASRIHFAVRIKLDLLFAIDFILRSTPMANWARKPSLHDFHNL